MASATVRLTPRARWAIERASDAFERLLGRDGYARCPEHGVDHTGKTARAIVLNCALASESEDDRFIRRALRVARAITGRLSQDDAAGGAWVFFPGSAPPTERLDTRRRLRRNAWMRSPLCSRWLAIGCLKSIASASRRRFASAPRPTWRRTCSARRSSASVSAARWGSPARPRSSKNPAGPTRCGMRWPARLVRCVLTAPCPTSPMQRPSAAMTASPTSRSLSTAGCSRSPATPSPASANRIRTRPSCNAEWTSSWMSCGPTG